MARGQHTSPQTKKYGKRRKSKNKLLSLIKNNNEVLRQLHATL
jgi:hypothetical protein